MSKMPICWLSMMSCVTYMAGAMLLLGRRLCVFLWSRGGSVDRALVAEHGVVFGIEPEEGDGSC